MSTITKRQIYWRDHVLTAAAFDGTKAIQNGSLISYAKISTYSSIGSEWQLHSSGAINTPIIHRLTTSRIHERSIRERLSESF